MKIWISELSSWFKWTGLNISDFVGRIYIAVCIKCFLINWVCSYPHMRSLSDFCLSHFLPRYRDSHLTSTLQRSFTYTGTHTKHSVVICFWNYFSCPFPGLTVIRIVTLPASLTNVYAGSVAFPLPGHKQNVLRVFHFDSIWMDKCGIYDRQFRNNWDAVLYCANNNNVRDNTNSKNNHYILLSLSILPCIS